MQISLFDEPPENTVQQSIQAEQADSSNDSMDNLLNKFIEIDISVDQRINDTELEFCKTQENIFYETRDVLKNTLQTHTVLYEKYKDLDSNDYSRDYTYIDRYKDINDIGDRIKSIYHAFVSRIVYYFSRKYTVSLSSKEIQGKYNEDTISYKIILDEIFEQLGGLTFYEKAVEELKVNSRETIYNPSKIEINKNKLTIMDYVWWEHTWDNTKKLSYSDSRVKPLFLALSHFMDGTVEVLYGLQSIYNQLSRGNRDFDIFSKYELTHNILQSLKFYKNGKIELVFVDNTTAEMFKTEYLL